MPKDLDSVRDYSSRKPRSAGYLITIDPAGVPTISCVISFTDPDLLEPAADAVRKFVYWPEDVTAAGALEYVHINSQGYGLSIPSLMPRSTDPVCDPSMEVGGPPGAEPIFKPKQYYQYSNVHEGKQATLTVIMRVKATGAVQLFCQAAGSNIDSFLEATYYFVAGFRFKPEAGRPDFTFTVTNRYLLR